MVGTQQPPTTLQRSLEHVAVSLLSIDLAKSWAARSAERSLRAALLRLAVEGRYDLAVTVTDQAAIPMPAPPMRMAVLSAPHEQLPELMELLESDPALQAASTLVAMIDSKRLGLITSADGGTQCLEAVLVQVPGARGGISEPASIDELGTAWDQAMNAFDACVDLGLPLAQPRDVTASRLVGHLDLPSVRAWAHELLEPLVQRDLLAGAELVDSLQVFLKHTGQVDRAAAALGVHRHTVRHRIQKIEQILGRSLDDATTRSELWIALQLTGRQDVG